MLAAGLAASAWAQTVPEGLPIETVETAGTVTLSRAEVLAVVRARPGQLFNEQQATEDARRIAKLDAAESAYYNAEVVGDKVRLTMWWSNATWFVPSPLRAAPNSATPFWPNSFPIKKAITWMFLPCGPERMPLPKPTRKKDSLGDGNAGRRVCAGPCGLPD
jgi:hypothetical protein